MGWPPQRACCRGNVVWAAFRRHQEAILGPCSSIMEWKGGHEPEAQLLSKRNMGTQPRVECRAPTQAHEGMSASRLR